MRDRLEAKTWREVSFYCSELKKSFRIRDWRVLRADCLKDANDELNAEIRDYIDREQRAHVFLKLYQKFEETKQLSKCEFNWLKKPFACDLIFAVLSQFSVRIDSSNREQIEKLENALYLIPGTRVFRCASPLKNFIRYQDQLKIMVNHEIFKLSRPCNHRERLNIIIKSLITSNISLQEQKKLMILFKDMWADMYQYSEITAWLGDDKNKVRWCQNYLRDKAQEQAVKFDLPWSPLDDKEAYHALIAQIHLNDVLDEKTTHSWLIKIKNAWNKKNARDKSKANKKQTPTPA